jgi:hypothetical protein
LRTGFGETVSFAAQLRHLLAAKRSAEMAQENQHERPLLPVLAEAFRRVVQQSHPQIGCLLVLFSHRFSPGSLNLSHSWQKIRLMPFDRTSLSSRSEHITGGHGFQSTYL